MDEKFTFLESQMDILFEISKNLQTQIDLLNDKINIVHKIAEIR